MKIYKVIADSNNEWLGKIYNWTGSIKLFADKEKAKQFVNDINSGKITTFEHRFNLKNAYYMVLDVEE